MSQSAPNPTPEARRDSGASPLSLTETLRRALADLEASAVGVARPAGGKPKYFTRTAQAAKFFEDIVATGLDALYSQASTSDAVVGTNRVRAEANGPVLGRLIAVALRDAGGKMIGLFMAVRTIDQAKFGTRESQLLVNLSAQVAAQIAPRREAAVPARKPAPPTPAWPAVVTPAPSAAAPATPDDEPELTASPSDIAAMLLGEELREKAASAPEISVEIPEASIVLTDVGVPKIDPAVAVPPALTVAPISAAVAATAAQTAQAPLVPDDVGPMFMGSPAAPAAVSSAPLKSSLPLPAAAAAKSPPLPVPTVALQTPVIIPAPPAPVVFNPPPSKPSASLINWADFEREIRTQETTDRMAGCVLYGDVDQLHVLNKLAGFASGDRAIAEVGGTIQTANLPEGARACHLSGDRFTVYVPRTTLAQGRRYAEQLCKSVSALSIEVHSVRTPLSISFGVALIPGNEGGLGHALAAAEAACKAAKDRGRGRVEVYQDADQSIVQRNDDVLVADRLRQALEAERLEVLAQPIVRLNGTSSVVRYELLVRLIGEAGTRLSPAWFMSAATRYRMLVELDRAVLAHVFRKLESQRAMLATKNLRFSVNLSGPTIGDPDFLEWVVSHIGGNGIPGDWLQFEITETAAVANVAQTQAMIRRLRSRGVQFALDDFGTGVSSFAYLKFFDVSMLKLDGSFVHDLLGNPRSESLVRGIAQLGRGMNIETVAECVETPEVRDRLAELGIDCAQGFLFGRPTPMDGVLATIAGTPT
jgi:diguanylate cyclase (GGDEF)-like protein